MVENKKIIIILIKSHGWRGPDDLIGTIKGWWIGTLRQV